MGKSFIDLLSAAQPRCRDPIQNIVSDFLGGTNDHWRSIYRTVMTSLMDFSTNFMDMDFTEVDAINDEYAIYSFRSLFFDYSNDQYYEYYGHYRNHWKQYDAVMDELKMHIEEQREVCRGCYELIPQLTAFFEEGEWVMSLCGGCRRGGGYAGSWTEESRPWYSDWVHLRRDERYRDNNSCEGSARKRQCIRGV